MYTDRLFCGQEKIEGLWTSCEKVNSQFPQKRKSDQHVKDPSHARHVIPRLFVIVVSSTIAYWDKLEYSLFERPFGKLIPWSLLLIKEHKLIATNNCYLPFCPNANTLPWLCGGAKRHAGIPLWYANMAAGKLCKHLELTLCYVGDWLSVLRKQAFT